MFNLYLRMLPEPKWNEVPESADPTYIASTAAFVTDNPFIPSGYTYLLQLIAHDMVATRVPFWAVDDLTTETANDRRTRLRLEALYGDGPMGQPNVFAPDTTGDYSRTRLQLGKVKVGEACPFRDLARLKLEHTLQDRQGTSEPLIADPRNDDHAIIAQLTMLFHHLHNTFVKLQPPVEPVESDPDFTHDTSQRFQRARDATTVLYRHIVRHDVMRRILHPAVYALYNQDPDGAILDKGDAGVATGGCREGGEHHGIGMPLEFSHGAFRFAHSMSRTAYRINSATNIHDGTTTLTQALEASSSSDVLSRVPLKPLWLVQWAYFFDFKGLVDPAQINLSHRIGPHIPDGLIDPARFGPIAPDTLGTGVIYRDLISAGLADLWSVDALIDAIMCSSLHREILLKSPLLADKEHRQAAVRQWLTSGAGAQTGDASIQAISQDPPLPFFVLFEAYREPDSNGCRLGVLGSIIVAEVVFGELHRHPMMAERKANDLNDRLEAIYSGFRDEEWFNGDVTMADVIQFVWKHLQKCPTEAQVPLIAPSPPPLGPVAGAARPEAAALTTTAALELASPPAEPKPLPDSSNTNQNFNTTRRSTMSFDPAAPVGDDYLSWGKLVMSWATGMDFVHGTGTPFNPPPGNITPDSTARLYQLPAGVAGNFMPPGMPIGVQFPPTVTEVVFVQDTATRRYIRLPQKEMVIDAYNGLKYGTLTYTLPPFYQAPPLNCADPSTFNTIAKLTLQADRVGDYSIGSCA